MDDLTTMGDQLIHRGPDGKGFYVDPSLRMFLLHRRLAILDIEGGNQPMWNEDRSVGVIFNGEIYNHLELRDALVAKGHVFRSDHSDTEVLVHGYEEWGAELPLRLNGMFAFAVYDARRKRLFFARDRFGKKPLYYSSRPGLFCFASEIKPLLRHSGVKTAVSRRSLQKFFAYGFIPAPHSLYQNIYKLPGGHWMTYDLDSETVKVEKYWEFTFQTSNDIPPEPEAVWGEELRHLLSQAVKRRLISDVPLGIFLSGGIDSSAILAFVAAQMPPEQIQTFSIGFHEPTFDESGYARAVAKHFGTDHHEELLSTDTARELVSRVLWRLDEPLGDSSVIPTYQLCEFSRRYITVALSGDGGDELFAGYDPFRALQLASWYNKIAPTWMKRGMRSLAELLPVSEKNMGFDFKIKRALRGASYSPPLWNPVWLGPLEPNEVSDLFNEPVVVEDLYDEAIDAWEKSSSDNAIDKTLEFYRRFYLQDDILMKVDRVSMMNSLEVRAPFLDNDVVDFARKIPYQFKYRNGQTKYILKKALEGVLPNEVLYRKKKGFGIPLTSWLRTWGDDDFTKFAPSYANHSWIRSRLAEHKDRKRDNRLCLWCWLVLQYHTESMLYREL
jgi:asparagine synthase (glutamine-hydrolysing)